MSLDMGTRRIIRSSLLIASAVSENRERWKARLAEAFDVFEVVEPRTLEKFMESLRPEVLVVDLALPKLGRANSLPHLRRLSHSTKILALTDVPDESEGMMVLKTGAKGYYQRAIDPVLLKKAAEAILRGEIWIQRKLVTNLVAEIISLSDSRKAETEDGLNPCLEGLTLRQRMVASMISKGACNKEIATHLKITERTVKAHLTETFRSLGITDRLQLALLLMKGHALAQPSSKSA